MLYKNPGPFCAMIVTDKLRINQKMKTKQTNFLMNYSQKQTSHQASVDKWK